MSLDECGVLCQAKIKEFNSTFLASEKKFNFEIYDRVLLIDNNKTLQSLIGAVIKEQIEINSDIQIESIKVIGIYDDILWVRIDDVNDSLFNLTLQLSNDWLTNEELNFSVIHYCRLHGKYTLRFFMEALVSVVTKESKGIK